jgi:hypothetical protein
MIAWMLVSALVALCLALAAHAAESTARLVGWSVRWIWVTALVLTSVLSISVVVRRPDTARGSPPVATVTSAPPRDVLGAPEWVSHVEHIPVAIRAALEHALARVSVVSSPAMDRHSASLALLASVVLALTSAAVAYRLRVALRRWPTVTLHRIPVRLAPSIGPLVVGFLRPQIVVPRWVLERQADEQHLVIAHEDEHVRAHDSVVLGLAWLAVLLMPWSPAVWYMLSRLRLAVELDCDARVLRRGAARALYCSLLLDVAERASSLRLSALGLSSDASRLRQRILAIAAIGPRFARLRASAGGAVALACLIAASEARLPASVVEAMPSRVPSAGQAGGVGRTGTSIAAAADLPARDASATEARAAHARSRAGDRRGSHRARGTRPASSESASPVVASPQTVAATGGAPRAAEALPVEAPSGPVKPSHPAPSFAGVILLDGARVDESRMRSLDRAEIERVEVIRGAAAALYSSDPDAVNGVIAIATKRGVAGQP